MKALLVALATAMVAFPAAAANITNSDAEAYSLQVTEGGVKSEVVVGPGETVSACPSGCFITFPNGDREALAGSETIEINGGSPTIK